MLCKFLGLPPLTTPLKAGKKFWLIFFPPFFPTIDIDWIGLREILQEIGNHRFSMIFPLNMGLSCKFSLEHLEPIHWDIPDIDPHVGCVQFPASGVHLPQQKVSPGPWPLLPRLAPGCPASWWTPAQGNGLVGYPVLGKGLLEIWIDSNKYLVGGWPTPLKNDGVSNSWADDIPNIWENNPHVSNHQPDMVEHKRYLKYVEITNQSSNSLPTLLPIGDERNIKKLHFGLFSLSIICIAAKASCWMPQISLWNCDCVIMVGQEVPPSGVCWFMPSNLIHLPLDHNRSCHFSGGSLNAAMMLCLSSRSRFSSRLM